MYGSLYLLDFYYALIIYPVLYERAVYDFFSILLFLSIIFYLRSLIDPQSAINWVFSIM